MLSGGEGKAAVPPIRSSWRKRPSSAKRSWRRPSAARAESIRQGERTRISSQPPDETVSTARHSSGRQNSSAERASCTGGTKVAQGPADRLDPAPAPCRAVFGIAPQKLPRPAQAGQLHHPSIGIRILPVAGPIYRRFGGFSIDCHDRSLSPEGARCDGGRPVRSAKPEPSHHVGANGAHRRQTGFQATMAILPILEYFCEFNYF